MPADVGSDIIRNMSYRRCVVAIVGGNVIVGRILETLLQSVGYDARFLDDVAAKQLDNFAGVQLVILAPLLDAGHRDTLVASFASFLATAQVPMLELVRIPDKTDSVKENRVAWPCSLAVLRREIEAVMPAGGQ